MSATWHSVPGFNARWCANHLTPSTIAIEMSEELGLLIEVSQPDEESTSHLTSTIFDSPIIVVAFGIDVALHGLAEELGSLVVVLRLWRVFKIIEIESANQDTLEEYKREIERLRQENTHLRQRLNAPTEPID
ncbi:hypothetical protein BBP40_002163 [Aspergillus hancockii]|nr:hypothetical protein BBP40_002163 [Aspergillus hancockii]